MTTVTLHIWGDDATTGTRFASLLDEIREGILDGDVDENTDAALAFARRSGATAEWYEEWCLTVSGVSEDVAERLEAAADAASGVRGYTRDGVGVEIPMEAMDMTTADAIARSITHDTIVTIPWTAEAETDLLAACDDSADTTEVAEYWGTDETGRTWRVHLER